LNLTILFIVPRYVACFVFIVIFRSLHVYK